MTEKVQTPKSVLFVGNGFNHLIKGMIEVNLCTWGLNQYERKIRKETIKDIDGISKLWPEFDNEFLELRNNQSIKQNYEEFIESFNSVLELLLNSNNYKPIIQEEKVNEVKLKLGDVRFEKIRNMAENFLKSHNDENKGGKVKIGVNARVKMIFPDFGDKFFAQLPVIISNPKNLPIQLIQLFQRKTKKIDIYTTNYDGILTTLLTSKGEFVTQDGFRPGIEELYLDFNEENFMNSNAKVLAHLHGSYLYEKKLGITKKKGDKNRNYTANEDPCIIFNAPNMKQEVIEKDNVLSVYFKRLKADLGKADRFIILGNSMKTEPHIKELIKQEFNKPENKIIICSQNEMSNTLIKHELKDCFNHEILSFTTENVKTQADLMAKFGEMFKA